MGVQQLRGRITGALIVLIFLLTASKLMAGTVTVNHGTGSANSISASSTDRDVYIVGPGAAATVGNYAVEYKTQNPIITTNLLHVKFDGAAFNGAAIRVCNLGGVNASDAVAAAMPSAGTNSYYIQVVQNIGAGNSVYFTDAAACNGANSNRFPVRLPASNTAGTVKITIDGVSSGGILVDPNATAAANLVIVTGGTCSYTLSATSASVGASNSTGSVSVTASASSCSWAAASNASWLTITSGSSGAGNGTVNYSVSANTATSSRTGVLTIGGQTFTITQSGTSGTLSTVSLNSADWMKLHCGNWMDTAEGLKVYNSGPRGGTQVSTKNLYNFAGKELYVKWKGNGGNSFCQFGPFVEGVESTSANLVRDFSTGNSWEGSSVITNDTWYFSRLRINADKTYTAVTATGNYDTSGGTVFRSDSGTIPANEWQFVEKSNIGFRHGDCYVGTSAYYVLGEVKTDAAQVAITTASSVNYTFEDGLIPSVFTNTGNWIVDSLNGYNSSRSITKNQSSGNSLIELQVTDVIGVSFRTKTNNSSIYAGYSQFNIYDSSGSSIVKQIGWQVDTTTPVCWNDISFYSIPGSGAKTLQWRAANQVQTWVDDITVYYATALNALTVTKSGTGSGTVTASTGTLTWSGSTGTASYNSGTSVTLTAAASTGSTFTGWSGACAGTATTCTVTMSAAQSVTATFTLAQQCNLTNGYFTATGSMLTPRNGHTNQAATLLPNGKVLITGGSTSVNSGIRSAELYDPVTGIFTSTGNMNTGRIGHTATLLPNGKVLIAGGTQQWSAAPTFSSAEIYDPASGTFTYTGNLINARYAHSATLLPNGKVLVIGGSIYTSNLNSAEIYDPTTGAFSLTGSMSIGRGMPVVNLLLDGTVLVTGGLPTNYPTNSAEIYTPNSGTFTSVGNMSNARVAHAGIRLTDGKVLVFGGSNGTSYISDVERYDPASKSFASIAQITKARSHLSATSLNNGYILLAGGMDGSGMLKNAEIYDPNNNTSSLTCDLLNSSNMVATLLANGKVLMTGIAPSAELFTPIPQSTTGTYNLPDTGQTKCYNTAGTEISCTGSGQDGAYNINPMSFTDNGNGTITDNVTGLMWQKEDDNTTRNWANAGTYCDSLTLGGQSDWRLPSKKELISIVDYGIPYPGPTINTAYFQNTNAGRHWASTTLASSTSNAWSVDFDDGDVSNFSKSSYGFYVRCVRGGGQSAPSFTDNGNGTVMDNGTGLIWQQGETGTMTWANALSYCEGLSLGGLSDWRLPNVKELESITDDTKYNPAINTAYFPNANASNYWLSTTYAYSTSLTWYVPFHNGSVSTDGYKSGYSFVRCVRGGQSGSTETCTLTLTPQTQALSAGAATGSVNVTASASSCVWTATTADTWITITTGSSGTGNGTVRYSVAANNPGTSSRTGTITIGGQALTVTQSAASAGCSYTTTASVQSLGGNGGTGTITVTPSGTGCNAEWFASSDVTWITFSNTCSSGICAGDTASGIGAGTVTFEASPNPYNTTRSANITIAGNIIPITQGSGQTCTTCGTTFNDVPTDNWAASYIYGIACSGITQGCGNSNYCVSNYVTRAHMAAFLVRGKEGEPPADYCASGSGFSDVATTDGFCKYIKRLGELQITLGCGNGNFCPNDYVTRGQMAAFLVRALYGENFSYTLTPYYSDVPATHGFFKYVQKLKDTGITRVSGTYNVNETVARDAMAAFLYRAFLETSCGNTSCTDASLKALVTDSQTGQPISGATVTVGSSAATTDSTGYARITGLTAQQNNNNTTTVNVSATGYVSDAATANISCGTENTHSVSLLPSQNPGTQRGDIRIILTWGENPIDIDSHLTGPKVSSSSSRFHVYYSSRNNCSSAACDSNIPAWLDVDDVTSYGPETITIPSSNNNWTYSFTPGTYRYSVHHYTGSSNLVNSGAAVKVYQGSQLLHTYTPPVPASGQTVAGNWVWTVFELNVSATGTLSFATIGTYSGPTGAGSVQRPDLNSAQKRTTDSGVLTESNTEDMDLFRRLERKR